MFTRGRTRPATPAAADRPRLVGLDLTATRLRGVLAADGRTRPLVLDDPRHDLPLFVTLDRRTPLAGHAAVGVCRTDPHSVCSGFLGLLGTPHEWHGERMRLDSSAALSAVFDAAREPVRTETTAAGLALPGYLSAAQVKRALELAAKAGLPVRGSASAALAVVSHRAASLGEFWPRGHDPAVLVIDADEFALSAALVRVTPTEATHLADEFWPKASARVWKDRLIDGLADRCVRVCRRDPRDSAEAEQHLYAQLDDALDRTRVGQRVTFELRGEHWYQNLTLDAEEVDALAAPVVRVAVDGLKGFLQSAARPTPPRAVWLTHAAGRLPGLAATIYRHSPEQTQVSILPADATAEAAAALLPRWLGGGTRHLDAAIPHDAPLRADAPALT